MSQLVPAALSLPGAGSATLPWGGRVSSQLPYIAEHEPQRAYCVRTAPATGWTMVELRAQYFSSYGVMYEIERMMHKLQPLGWTSTIPVPGSSLYQSLWLWTSNTWTKTLTNGTVAHVHLWYDRKLNAYEFDATALPAKTYYRHC